MKSASERSRSRPSEAPYSFTSARNVLITRCVQKDPPPPQMKLWNPPNIMQQAAKAEKNYAHKLRENICH